ncbi:hypothetical protein [Tomitella gaofuii]|uniref:hypothetical protein n=1 Tax=Tomitella gaofuii TaxID=2760083 RepID=UPI0015FC114E|nr:hypothetical protein [Tomitella gaofuii]
MSITRTRSAVAGGAALAAVAALALPAVASAAPQNNSPLGSIIDAGSSQSAMPDLGSLQSSLGSAVAPVASLAAPLGSLLLPVGSLAGSLGSVVLPAGSLMEQLGSAVPGSSGSAAPDSSGSALPLPDTGSAQSSGATDAPAGSGSADGNPFDDLIATLASLFTGMS